MSKKLYFAISFVLALNLASIACSAPSMIRMDFDYRGYVRTEPGFTSFTLSENSKEVNSIIIDVTGDVNDCRRSDPNTVTSGIEIYTEQVYRDMVYGKTPSGVTITLWGLGANQQCDINIYAFDNNSTPRRLADWYGNGTYLFTTDFEGGDVYLWPSPWWGIDYVFGPNTVTADEFGRIVLTSTKNSSSPAGKDFAFVDGLVAAPKGTYTPTVYAQHPVPFDDTTSVPVNTTLSWKKSTSAATHDIYLGTDVTKVTDANRSNPQGVLVSQDYTTTTYAPPGDLSFGTTYYWRIDEVNETPSLVITKGEVWSFTTRVLVLIASNPVPLDGAGGVYPDAILSWQKGEYADKHDVYLDTNSTKVNNASRSSPLGVLVSENQSAATYDPPGTLDSDTTYYWRIDEVNSAPDYTIFKGNVWSFTTSYGPSSRTILPPYEVGTWQGFRSAAVTYTFDDGYMPNLYSIAIPMFNEPNFGFKLTMYPIPGWMSPSQLTAMQAAAAEGHEVGSHTVTHPDLTSLSPEQLTAELVNSKNTINSYIPGEQCRTLAYPNCSSNENVRANTALYYIAARGCASIIEPNTPANFYNINSFVCGSSGLNSLSEITSKFTTAVSSQGWCVLLIHALDGDSGYSPLSSTILRGTLDYLAANRSTFWVQTFGNVVRYIRERNNITLTELSNTGSIIILDLTDTLNDAIYNYPVTLRRPLPEGWTSATVLQNGQPVDVCSVTVGSTPYIMFDVVPDGGHIVLMDIYGDFTDNGIVDMNDFSIFIDFWLVNDCNETAGIDLDEDCLVNFYEYAFMAKNWLL